MDPKYRWWIVFSVLILALIPYYIYGWVPLTERVDDARQQAELAEAELEHARRVHARQDEMQEEISELREAMREMDTQIIEATYQPEFLVYLQDTEQANGVSISAIDYGAVEQLSDAGGVLAQLNFAQVGVTLTGTYQQVRRFVTEMEEGIWFTVSESFDFYSSGEEVEGRYNFRVFFWPEVSDPELPHLPDFPGTGRGEPFRSW